MAKAKISKEDAAAKSKELASAGISKFKGGASGFMTFIKEQNVVGLAVGLVLGLLLGSAEGIKGLTAVLGTTPTGEVAVLRYGEFVNDLINFLVLALVIYIVVKALKLDIKK